MIPAVPSHWVESSLHAKIAGVGFPPFALFGCPLDHDCSARRRDRGSGHSLKYEIHLWSGSVPAIGSIIGDRSDSPKNLQLELHLLPVGAQRPHDQ